MRMGAVLDEGKVAVPAEAREGVDVRDPAILVHEEDGGCSRPASVGRGVDAHAQVVGSDVDGDGHLTLHC